MTWVLFYDGECAFCSRSVRNVIRFDHRAEIFFAPLQGEFSRKRGFTKYAGADGGTMVLLRESDGRIFTHSDGLIEIARVFGGWWGLLTLARFIPKPLRDAVYRIIARNRYRIMGKADHCALPDAEMLKRQRE